MLAFAWSDRAGIVRTFCQTNTRNDRTCDFWPGKLLMADRNNLQCIVAECSPACSSEHDRWELMFMLATSWKTDLQCSLVGKEFMYTGLQGIGNAYLIVCDVMCSFIIFKYQFVCIMGFSARGQCSISQGWDNVRTEGECIIHPRPLLHCPSAQTNPILDTKLVSK